jgi:hypothetical protein
MTSPLDLAGRARSPEPFVLDATQAGRKRRARRIWAALIGVLTLAVTFGIAAWSYAQSQNIAVQADVTSNHCGYSRAAGGTTCIVDLNFTAPDDSPGLVEFHGIDSSRIHRTPGGDRVVIYFSSAGSETPISPQDVVPVWVAAFLAVMVWFIGGALIWWLLASKRARTISAFAEGAAAVAGVESGAAEITSPDPGAPRGRSMC